jgi:type II secretory pathway pseudopilin PulG
MKVLPANTIPSRVQRQSAFALVESVVGLMIAAIMLTSLYGAFLSGFSTLRLSRERLRATQVMLTRLEGMRLCSFEQLTNPTYNPPTFTEVFDPKDQSSGKGGVTYTGTFTPREPPVGSFPESYRTKMLFLDVTVSWNSGKTVQTASMQTYAAKEGIENYVKLGR